MKFVPDLSLIIKMSTIIVETPRSALVLHDFEHVDLLKACAEEIDSVLDWHPAIHVFGKICHQNRSLGFFSDTSIGYAYSGQMAESKPLTPCLSDLLDYINKKFGQPSMESW